MHNLSNMGFRVNMFPFMKKKRIFDITKENFHIKNKASVIFILHLKKSSIWLSLMQSD